MGWGIYHQTRHISMLTGSPGHIWSLAHHTHNKKIKDIATKKINKCMHHCVKNK